jgi:acetyl esterase/lipase
MTASRIPLSFLILCAILGAPPPVPAASPARYLDEVFPKVSIALDLVYGEAPLPNGRVITLRLDLYQPAGDHDKLRPAIVWVHGGGFFEGDKGDPALKALAERFARRGYVAISMNYRLSRGGLTDHRIMGPILDAAADARAAIRWLRRNAAAHRIDPAKIAIGGGSAGAFTALLVGYAPGGQGESTGPGGSSRVAAVIDFWGGLLDPAIMTRGGPPLLVVHGTADRTVPFALAESLVRRAREVGVVCEFHPVEDQDHAPWAQMDLFVGWVAPFLYRHLGLEEIGKKRNSF